MNRNFNNIGFPKYPCTKKHLLNIIYPINFYFIQATDIETIKMELATIHYTAHQILEQVGPKTLLLDIAKRLSVNEQAYV